MRTFELCSSSVTTCIDISADSTLLACGSGDNTTRIWNLDTGKLVAGPFKSYYLRGSVRLSHDSKKLAVNSAQGRWLEVWDVKTQKLDVRVGKNDSVALSYPPVFWTTKDKTIVSAFNFDEDTTTDNLSKTIYEFDASTLQTVGGPFEGHTSHIYDLALSFDCALLASASRDEDAIKLWAFESRQLLASFDVHQPIRLLFSPNSHQLAYTNWENTEIRIYDIPSEILGLDSEQEVQPNNSARKKDLLNSDATRRAVRRKPVISPVTSFAPRPLRPSPMTYPQERDFLRYLRKVLPSRTNKVRNVQPRDPLDFPVTSPLPQNYSHSAQETTRSHSRMNPHENSRPPITQSSSTASTSFKARLRTGHGLPPVVDVPLAQGRERNAAAGAPPKNGEGWIPDEDFVPSRPPSPNPNSQPPPAVQINTGEHGRVGRLCFCF